MSNRASLVAGVVHPLVAAGLDVRLGHLLSPVITERVDARVTVTYRKPIERAR
jgi:hypothetical protein